eukprot:scaffold4017_cov199-Ochromonas_danica.AAC.1
MNIDVSTSDIETDGSKEVEGGYLYVAVVNQKSMLKPNQIWVGTSSSSETSLISLLQDLTHLNSLRLEQVVNNHRIH